MEHTPQPYIEYCSVSAITSPNPAVFYCVNCDAYWVDRCLEAHERDG